MISWMGLRSSVLPDSRRIIDERMTVAAVAMTIIDGCIRTHNGIHTKDEDQVYSTLSGKICKNSPRGVTLRWRKRKVWDSGLSEWVGRG